MAELGLGVQMYGSKKLTTRNVKFSGNPYDMDEAVLVELRALGIFFYRDEKHSRGIVVDTVDTPIQAFYHQAVFDEEEMCVDEWEDTPKKQQADFGDDYCWLRWNKEVVVLYYTPESVKIQ